MRFLALIPLTPILLAAQEPTPKTLASPIWTAVDGLSAISAVRELPDGRVIALDRRENRVVLFAANGQSMTDVGRKGSGPGEYVSPVVLLALPGDSTAILDQGPRRMLILGPDAKPVTTMSFPIDIGSQINVVRGVDARGRFYFPAPMFGRALNPAGETIPILAWDRATDKRDTVGSYQGGPTVQVGNANAMTTYFVRYASLDEWVLLSNGRIAVLRGEPYSMTITGGGAAAVRGPRIPYQPVAVADTERVPKIIADRIPSTKPAFWGVPPIAGPDSDVWVVREMPFGSKTRIYDHFDRSANRTFSLTTESTIRIVGFGKSAMFTVRTDADGLQWLEKRPIPR
jgi:hypothetical protein